MPINPPQTKMMQNEDLDLVADLVRTPLLEPGSGFVSRHLLDPNGDLWRSDLWRLRRSAECAFHAAEMERGVFEALAHLCEALRDCPQNSRLIGPADADAWRGALAAARADSGWTPKVAPIPDREQIVGEACKRLRERGRKVRVRAYGPDWNEASLKSACASVDRLISRLGGATVVDQLGHVMRETAGTFEDIWLFGDRNLGLNQAKQAGIPYGWLIGLAARHMHRPNTCRRPDIAWRSLITQAQDIAASFDCQRYSQYEGMGGLAPSEIDAWMSESIEWRALFFTPQGPKLLLPRLRTAFHGVLVTREDRAVRPIVLGLFDEMIRLADRLAEYDCLVIREADAERVFPLLCEFSRAGKGSVNRAYCLPVRASPRDDTGFVLFEGPKNSTFARPMGMSVHAFCETVFRLIRGRLPRDRASKIVGDVMEIAIARACDGKADEVQHDVQYGSKGQRLQIDVAARSGAAVTLVETKAKSLTGLGQAGTSGAFYADYAKSFLPMVHQLARHTRHLQNGATPLATAAEGAALSIERIAVSPVSFGPIGDGLTTSALISALPGIRIHPLYDDENARKASEDFNKVAAKLIEELHLVVPVDNEGSHDFFDFFLYTHWLDLGQFLVAIDRVNRVEDALRSIRHFTTGSRDFWTEYAHVATFKLEREKSAVSN